MTAGRLYVDIADKAGRRAAKVITTGEELMRRFWFATRTALACAALPGAATAGVKYAANGPNLAVPIVDNTKQPIAPWVQADADLAGNVVFDQVYDYFWTSYPPSAGRLQLRAVRSFATGRIVLYVGISPANATPSTPRELAVFGLDQLDFDIGRMFASEKTAPVTHVRSEQNQATKLYHLVFTFDTPLPKDRMTWLVVKTNATRVEPGATVTFADNESGLGRGKYPFVRGASGAAPMPAPTPAPSRGKP